MITVTFYNNGWTIRGHARPDVCSEISIFAWTASNIMLQFDDDGDWYTSCDDNSNAGYGHFAFDTGIEAASRIFQTTKKMLPMWADFSGWIKDGHVQIIETEEILVIPHNFKELNGITVRQVTYKCPICMQEKDPNEWMITGKCQECRDKDATCTICNKLVEPSYYVYINAKDGVETGRGHQECLEHHDHAGETEELGAVDLNPVI